MRCEAAPHGPHHPLLSTGAVLTSYKTTRAVLSTQGKGATTTGSVSHNIGNSAAATQGRQGGRGACLHGQWQLGRDTDAHDDVVRQADQLCCMIPTCCGSQHGRPVIVQLFIEPRGLTLGHVQKQRVL